MLLKKDSYIHKQITFGLLGLRRMFDDKTLSAALKKSDLKESREILEASVAPEYMEMLEFVIEDLFSTEEGTERINEVYSDLYSVDVESFVISYRYRSAETLDDYTNGCIEEIAASIIQREDPSNVMDLCSGQGVFLTTYFYYMDYYLGTADKYCGIEINKQNAMVSKIKYLILGLDPDNITIGDVFNSNFNGKAEKYDAVFCHMPINMPIDTDKVVKAGLLDEFQAQRISKRESEWAFIKAMLAMINKQRHGMGVAWVRSSLLFSEVGKEFRKELIRYGMLEGIILLPPGMLNVSGVQTALMIIRSNNDTVKMVDASDWAVKGRRANYIPDGDIPLVLDLYYTGGDHALRPEDPPCYTTVSTKEIADNDYSFDPTRYILKEHLHFEHEAKLSDVTTKIFRGVQIKADERDTMSELYGTEPNCYLLNLSDISNGYIEEVLEKVNIDNLKKYKKYMLQPNDVIISARGTKISIAVADDKENRDVIVTGNLIAIRCGEDLDPYYLKAFFESNNGTAMLRSAQTGGNIFAINPRQLQEMSIELMNPERQKLIGEKTKWMIDELRDSNMRVASIKEKLTHIFDETKEV